MATQRANFFEKELRKIVESPVQTEGNNNVIADIRYVGRIAMGRLSCMVNAKIELCATDTIGQYSALKLSALNRNMGIVDSVAVHFADVLGEKVVSNPNFKDGIVPRIWMPSSGKPEWYVYQPTADDYSRLSDIVRRYFGLFTDSACGCCAQQ